METTQNAIIRTLLYFDIFRHPLDKKELFAYLGAKTENDVFENALGELISKKLVCVESDYYHILNGASYVYDRIKKIKKSEKFRRIASVVSRIIFMHPFVRGVFISGSLSKSAFSNHDDIDFFVITEPGRLWICKTFLMLFKKIFLLNSKKYFCINYFVDLNSLEIPEKNIFTATELAFLIPVQNHGLFEKIIAANSWIRIYYPNKRFIFHPIKNKSNLIVKKFIEWVLKGALGNYLDNFFMKIYQHRAKRKFTSLPNNNFDLNFKSSKKVSKFHPNGYQEKILEYYKDKIAGFEVKHHTTLDLPKERLS